MTTKILRGRVLNFLRKPQSADDTSAFTLVDDGAIAIAADGKISAVGEFDKISDGFVGEVVDHRPNLIMSGFIDPHLHFVQMQVVGSYAGSLLEWLNTYTFVEEQRFGQEAHAAYIASAFFDELVRNGTTTAAAYCSVHAESATAFFPKRKNAIC